MKLLAHVYAHPSSVHRHLHTSVATPPSERPADGSLRSDFSPISISGRGLHWGRGAIPLEPSPAASIRKPSSASLGVIQDMCLDDTDKGREAFAKIQGLVRKTEARSREALVEVLGTAISAVSAMDARGYFKHSGYRLSVHLL